MIEAGGGRQLTPIGPTLCPMCTLVTGGTGFIGRYVVDRLLDSGESVVSYDRAPAASGLPRDVRSVQGELFDLSRLAATISEHRVSGIVHAAGMSDPLLSIGMPAATVAANATGTLTCSRRAASHASADASSCSRPRACTATTRTWWTSFPPPPADALRGNEGLQRPARAGLLTQLRPRRGLIARQRGLRARAQAAEPARGDHRRGDGAPPAEARRRRRPAVPPGPRRGCGQGDHRRARARVGRPAGSMTSRGERVPLEQVVAIVRDRLPHADIEFGRGS